MDNYQESFIYQLDRFLLEDLKTNLKELYPNYTMKSLKCSHSGIRLNSKCMPFVIWRTSLYLGLLVKLRPSDIFGLMITASHNPPQDNGFKIFCNLSDSLREEFKKHLQSFIQEENFCSAFINLANSSFYSNFSQPLIKVNH